MEPLISDAELALRLGDLTEAERLYGEVRKHALPAKGRARVLAGLGRIAFAREDLPTAIRRLEESRRIPSGGPVPPDVIDILGRAYAMTGRFERSIALFERALQEAEIGNDQAVRVRFRLLLANALIDGGRFREAEAQLAPLVGKAMSGDALECARIYWTRSRLRTLQGQHELAAGYARRVLELLEGCEDIHYRSRAHQMAAHIELACGRADEALELIDRAEELLGPTVDAFDRGKLVLERAHVKLATGQELEAASLAQAAATILADLDAHDRGRAYLLLADTFSRLGERARAIEIYELAEELLADAPSRFMVEALQRHADLLEQEHSVDEAIRLLKRALALQRSWRAAPR